MNPRIAQNTAGMPVADFPAVFQINIDAVEAHPLVFTDPDPTILACQEANDALTAKLERISALEMELAMTRVERDELYKAALAARVQLAIYVMGVAKGDPAIMLLAGFVLAAPPGPPQPMPKVLANKLTALEVDGAGLGEWDPTFGAKSYEVSIAADANGPWAFYKVVTEARVEITGQPSGQKLWSRVRAVNKLGPGPWSDPACCMIG